MSMKRLILGLLAVSLILLGGGNVYAQSGKVGWVTAYYAGWMQGNKWSYHLKPKDIDFTGLTHVIHFSLIPLQDATFHPKANAMTEENSRELVSAARSKGVKALISVGGWQTEANFAVATSETSVQTFCNNLVSLVLERGYEGIDIDWEPLSEKYYDQYEKFISILRTKMKNSGVDLVLTAATGHDPELFARIHHQFDQINIMTYDMSGAWSGWASWHNAALRSTGSYFPRTRKPLPSAELRVSSYIDAGVPKNKIGIGIDFYGYVWSGGNGTPTGGVTQPRQTWSTPPKVKDNVPYFKIMKDYFRPEFLRWDEQAEAAYLSIDNPGSEEDMFISFDDELACERKLKYVANNELGGVFIWELGGGYIKEMPQGQRDPLLASIRRTLVDLTSTHGK